jgi:acyl-CoA thioesterase FadM
MYTAKLSVRYCKPVPTEQPLKIVAQAGKSKRRSAISTAEIFGPDGVLLAVADAVLVNVPEATLNRLDHESLGWKVYPDEE